MATNRISFRLVGVVAVLAVLAAACQNANDIGVLNLCGERVESRGSSIPVAEDSTSWHTIDRGERSYVVSTGEDSELLYLAVRSESGPTVRFFTLAIESLRPAGDGADYDTEVVLGGETCSPILE